MFESLLRDARHAVRLLMKSPLFTITAVATLAIGIGANTTIFSVANGMLLRPLPALTDPGRLVDVGRTTRGSGFDTVSYPNFVDFRSRTTTLQGVYAYRMEPEAMSLAEGGQAERVYGTLVSGNYFDVLGTPPRLGRMLRDSDDVEGASPVAVVSSRLWARRFGSDSGLVGRTITLNGSQFTIVGVAPEGFQGTTILASDVWTPLATFTQAVPRMDASMLKSRRSLWLFMGGRLKDGVTVAQANAEAAAIGAALEKEFPENANRSMAVKASAPVPGVVEIIAGFLAILMAMVGLVLLIACVNIAGMLLARGVSRRREIAVRLAIGAGRGRLIRQLMTETAVLFVAGGIAGVLLSGWMTSLLLSLLPQLPMPVSLLMPTDWRVVSFATAVSFAAALLAGLAPALQAARADLVPALKAESSGGGAPRLRLRNAFVMGQVALSLVLIVAAGLFLRALQRAASIDPGFDQANVDVVSLDLSTAGYKEATGRVFVGQLLERARSLPGVEAVSLAVDLPLDGNRFGLGEFKVPGVEPLPDGAPFSADWNVVEPGYFTTLRLPLRRGRDFSAGDTESADRVAVVNQAFAERFWPGQEAIGRTIVVDEDSGARPITIVGVTAEAKLVSLGEPDEPMIYVPFSQRYMDRVNVVVRGSAASSIAAMRTLIREMNPILPVSEAMPLADLTAIGVVPQRIAGAVAASLGVVGLLLAAIGIYGVTSYTVSSRTREIGIRVALGADRTRVVRLVVRQAAGIAAIGIGIGIAIAAAASRLLESLLFGVPSLDPITFGAAALIFAAIALAACYLPARRAAAVDPMVALRTE